MNINTTQVQSRKKNKPISILKRSKIEINKTKEEVQNMLPFVAKMSRRLPESKIVNKVKLSSNAGSFLEKYTAVSHTQKEKGYNLRILWQKITEFFN